MFLTLVRGQRDTRLCPYLVQCATLYPLMLPQPLGLPYFCLVPPLLFLQSIFFRLRIFLLCLPWPFQFSSCLFSPLHTQPVPESIVLKYNEQPYSAFSECRSTSSQTPPLQRCNTTLCPDTDVGASLSVVLALGPGTPPGPGLCGGYHPSLCTEYKHRLGDNIKEKSGHL